MASPPVASVGFKLPDRAVLAPERFRGGLPLRRPAIMGPQRRDGHGTGTLPHGVISDATLTPVGASHSADLAGLPARGELVTGMGRRGFVLGALAGQ
jgi:hypothetical protein